MLSEEILYNIFDFVPYGKESMVNKTLFKRARNNALTQFFSDNSSEICDGYMVRAYCGHRHCTKTFSWRVKVGYQFDEDGEYVDYMKLYQLHLCNTCFAHGLLTFITKFKCVPYMRIHGGSFANIVKQTLNMFTEQQLLAFISSDIYRDMDNIQSYWVEYYYQKHNGDALLKYDSVKSYLSKKLNKTL